MDNDQRQQILVTFSNWMQVTGVRENKHTLTVSGFLRPGESPESVQNKAKHLSRKIHYIRDGYTDQFTLNFQNTLLGIPRINLLLFIATVITTLFAGALMEGVNPLENPLLILRGVPFSITLLLILGIHESGHFLMSRKHRVDATLPYFIPAPTIIGTFGAFIKMRSPVKRRRALVEIGAAGPIAGFLAAVPALFIGLSFSTIVPKSAEMGVQLGESLLMKIATFLIFPDLGDQMDVVLHPIAFAAWIGMLVTMLNLLPIGQLDGGHIAYALMGKWYKPIGWGALISILVLSIFSANWLVWAALVYFLTRMKHPPILDGHLPVTQYEKVIGIIALVIFILTFIPIPFKF